MDWSKVDPDLRREMNVEGNYRIIVQFVNGVDPSVLAQYGLTVLNVIKTIRALVTIANYAEVAALSLDQRVLRLSLAGPVMRT